MAESHPWHPIEIQQSLLLMIHQYGLPALLNALADLAHTGNLDSTTMNQSQLQSMAHYLSFAASEASELDSELKSSVKLEEGRTKQAA